MKGVNILKVNKVSLVVLSLLCAVFVAIFSATLVNADTNPSKAQLVKEERRVLEEKIKKGEIVRVNPVVNVYDKDDNLVWTGRADEWRKVGKEVTKSIRTNQSNN